MKSLEEAIKEAMEGKSKGFTLDSFGNRIFGLTSLSVGSFSLREHSVGVSFLLPLAFISEFYVCIVTWCSQANRGEKDPSASCSLLLFFCR